MGNIADGFSTGEGEICKGVAVRTPHPAPKLIKLRKTEVIGVFYDEGVAAGHVYAAFDNGGANKNICFVVQKALPDIRKFFFAHLAVGISDFCIRKILL